MRPRQPRSSRGLGDADILHILRGVSRQSRGGRKSAPDAVSIQLTHRCNLRCGHCFQWGATGSARNLHHDILSNELDFEVIKEIVEDSRLANTALYIWGGEPFVYRKIDDLLELLGKHGRQSIITTNGVNLHTPTIRPSWHSYDFRISSTLVERTLESLRRTRMKTWNTHIRIQPLGKDQELKLFLDGAEEPITPYVKCSSIFARANVLPNGSVTTCKLFPEFAIGNLSNSSLMDIWNSAIAEKTRLVLARSLTPICTRCVQLYQCRGAD